MNQKVFLQKLVPIMFALSLAALIALLILNDSNLPVSGSNIANVEIFDYEHASEITAMRWQAMAQFYKEHGLLTRDDFDYEQAADLMAYRWNAMARRINEWVYSITKPAI